MAKKEYFDFLDDVIINNVKMKNLYEKFEIDYSNLIKGNDILLELTMVDGDTPQSIAYQYYNDKKYYWILLLVNNIVDYFYDWYLSYEEVRTLTNKYWDDDINYDLPTKEDLFQYLDTENDKKKVIKYLNPKYLNDFLKEVNNG